MDENENMTAQGHCSGNCMKCNPFQRALCSSQVSYYSMKILEGLTKQMSALQGDVTALAEKVAGMQNTGTLFNPIAQEGDGV